MSIGTTYKPVDFSYHLVLERIITKIGDTKLPRPIYEFKYVGVERKNVTMYREDLERLLNFERWKKV